MRLTQYASLQVLRAVAAISVVCHHVLRAVTIKLPKEFPNLDIPVPAVLQHPRLIELGSFGVDLFFVLSGFLMVYISEPYRTGRQTIGHFIVHRIIRIWPLYVLATLAALAPSIMNAAHSGTRVYDLQDFRLLGLVFVPSFDTQGLLQPILGVGWTLQYEALFYLCFAVTLLFLRQYLLLGLTGLLTVLYLFGSALPSTSVAGAFLSNGIIFEFLYGAAIASTLLSGRTIPQKYGVVALTVGVVALFACVGVSDESPYRLFARGIPAALMLIGMISLERAVAWPTVLLRLGDASYSIYLVQILVIYRIVRRVLMPTSEWGLGGGVLLAVVIAIIGTVLAGVLVRYCIEVPLLARCHAAYRQLRSRRTAAQVEKV